MAEKGRVQLLAANDENVDGRPLLCGPMRSSTSSLACTPPANHMGEPSSSFASHSQSAARRQVRGCQVRLPRDRYCSVERARPQLLMVCATGCAAIAELRVAVSRGVQNSTPFRMLRDPRHGLAGLQVAPHDVLPGQGLKDCMLKFA